MNTLRDLPGFDEEAFIKVHELGEIYPSVRFNPRKMNWREQADATINHWFQDMEKIPWCEWGRWLDHRPSFIFDPCWHAGAYYVQEASSMFLHHVLRALFPSPEKDIRVLDLCAAPGGKSSLLASHFTEQLVVSNEVIQSRASILTENLTRWGSPNVVVTQNDARDFKSLMGFFDLIVVDAPCSGSGLFRKDPDAIEEWSTANVALCSQRQQRILNDVLPALAEGGILVYSTCSYSQQEDEEIVDWLLSENNMECISIPLDKSWNIIESKTKNGGIAYRFYPDKIKGEGFFISCLRKQTAETEVAIRRKTPEKFHRQKAEILRNWVKDADAYAFTEKSGNIIAMPAALEESIFHVGSALRIKKSGTLLGKFAGNDLIPDHEFAMSQVIRESIPEIKLDLDNALAYLRKETLPINQTEKGWMLVSYNGLKLGWVKVLDRRINNYYPPSWRILKG